MMSLAKTPRGTTVQAYQCGLWFCLQSYKVAVTNGIAKRIVTSEWSKSDFAPKGSAHYGEYAFVDAPPEMNVKNHSRYSVSSESLETLNVFMNKLTAGNVSQVGGVVTYDSDWVQAMEAGSKDLSSWISRLALSLTKDIQLTGTVRPGSTFDYNGIAYIMATHVEVNWYWVAYPVTLMIFAFLYLIQTV
jgi:hypothetical protein